MLTAQKLDEVRAVLALLLGDYNSSEVVAALYPLIQKHEMRLLSPYEVRHVQTMFNSQIDILTRADARLENRTSRNIVEARHDIAKAFEIASDIRHYTKVRS